MPQLDIRALGDKELAKKLDKLVNKTQKKIVRQALRKESYQVRKRVVANIGRLGLVQSGVMMQAYATSKIRASGKRGLIRMGMENPYRSELGISPDDKYYYPYAVEFGHDGVAPKPFQRPAIDEHKSKSIRDIGRDIGNGIEREARKP